MNSSPVNSLTAFGRACTEPMVTGLRGAALLRYAVVHPMRIPHMAQTLQLHHAL